MSAHASPPARRWVPPLWLRLLRVEGRRSLRARIADQRADARRRRDFRLVDRGSVEVRAETLRVLPFPLSRKYGGTALQLLARLAGTDDGESIALLSREPNRFRLELRGDSRSSTREALAIESPAPPPPRAVELADERWVSAIRDAAELVDAKRIHLESVASLPLAAAARLIDDGFDLSMAVHDFSLYCARPHLVEEPAGLFCDYSRDDARCARCLAETWPSSEEGFIERRRVGSALLARASRIEFPSDFLLRQHERLFPGSVGERGVVVAPRAFSDGKPVPRRQLSSPPRRIAFVGAFSRHKGAAVFLEVVARLASRSPQIAWIVFGGVGDLPLLARARTLPGVTVRGYYRAGSLSRRLVEDRVDLALLLSIAPEAYGLTLDECADARVPVLAFDLGAPAERIRERALGETVPLGGGAVAIADWIAARSRS